MMDTTILQQIVVKQNQIKVLTDEINELKASEGYALLERKTYIESPFYVKVSRNARWDEARALEFAKEKYPLGEDGTNEQLYEITVKVRKDIAKKMFAPEDYAACEKEYLNKVEVGAI